MKLGDYEIPEIRLMPNAMTILDEIYSVKQRNRVLSKGLAIHLGFKYGTETYFYKKLRTLLSYGLLEGKGSYQVSELGESLLHPRTDKIKEIAKTKAVLNVELWKLIKDKVGVNPREDNFWSVLVDITKTDPNTAKKEQSKILKWYLEDIELISEDLIESELDIGNYDEDQHLSQGTAQNNQMSQQMAISQTSSLGQLTVPSMGTIEINDSDTLTIARTYLDVLEKKIKELEKVENIEEEPQSD